MDGHIPGEDCRMDMTCVICGRGPVRTPEETLLPYAALRARAEAAEARVACPGSDCGRCAACFDYQNHLLEARVAELEEAIRYALLLVDRTRRHMTQDQADLLAFRLRAALTPKEPTDERT